MHPVALRQARVHHGRRLVYPAAQRSQHAVHERPQLIFVGEALLAAVQPPVALEVHASRTVHHDLGDGVVCEQPFQRAEAEHGVQELALQSRALRGWHISPGQALEHAPAGAAHLAARTAGILCLQSHHFVGGHDHLNLLLKRVEAQSPLRPLARARTVTRTLHPF